MRHTHIAAASSLAALVCALASARPLHAATCPASSYTPRGVTREARLLEAGVLATSGKYADARATYLSELVQKRDDPEALFGLARIDAWEGCLELSERSYRRALAITPRDAELRAGLIDVYTWQGRYDEARRMIDEGLAMDPRSPALLARRARARYWAGESGAAIDDLDAAIRASPGDAELRAMRERMFVGEARVAARLDHFPSAYPDLYSLTGQVLQRAARFEFWAGAQALRRQGGAEGAPVTDARFPIGIGYRPSLGTIVGAELSLGTPAHAIPNWAVRAFAVAPLSSRLSAHLGYSFWHFSNGSRVHVVAPAIGVDLPFDLHVDARAWISSVTLLATGDLTRPGTTELAVAAGPQVTWSGLPRLTLGAFYTYGAELDQNPTLYQVISFRSHSTGIFADRRLTPTVGVRPMVGLQRREGGGREGIFITAFELGAYVRW